MTSAKMKKRVLSAIIIFAFCLAGVRAVSIYSSSNTSVTLSDVPENAIQPMRIIDSSSTGGSSIQSYDINTAELISDSTSPKIAITAKCDSDFFNCRLLKEITKTHRFLQRNENGLPYTPDPRNLTPKSEEFRLIIDTQANGYLNLYKMTKEKKFLKEAETRLDYMLRFPDQIIGNQNFNGQVGFSFLSAYEFDKNISYLETGLKIADLCMNQPEEQKVLNWGLMCAMDLSKAYKITKNLSYLNESRKFVRNSAAMQLSDGSFPHNVINDPAHASSAPYTIWMIYELNQIRSNDPENPDIDAMLIKAAIFLSNRVNQDGSLNYEDSNGTYYWDSSRTETRGYNSDMPGIAYDLKTTGEIEKTKKSLQFLFSQENYGNLSGSYPDKWAFFDINNTWANSNTSVARTSLIFWYLTSIPLIDNSCQNGIKIPCIISENNCNSGLRELGQCGINSTGINMCINGKFSNCINTVLINFTYSVCDFEIYDCSPENPYCPAVCEMWGYKKCINTSCTSCFHKLTGGCGDMCFDYPVC